MIYFLIDFPNLVRNFGHLACLAAPFTSPLPHSPLTHTSRSRSLRSQSRTRARTRLEITMSARPQPSRRLFLGMAATTPLALSGVMTLGAGTAHAADSAYVMCYFTESTSLGAGTDYGLHLAVSTDSLNWTPLNQNNPVVTPTAGALGLRDPFLMRKQDGTFVVLATDLKGTDWGYNSQYIHVWDSADLRTFTGYRRLKLHDMATHSWAPEAFWDAGRGQYAVIYSAVNSSGHNVIMVNYTSDFVTASAPQVFFDPGYDVIDGDMAVGVNGYNYLFFKKNETLVSARSTTLNPGSFTEYSAGVSHGGTEAPTVVKSLTSGNWYLWGDIVHAERRLLCLADQRPGLRHVDRARPEDVHPAGQLEALRHHDDHDNRVRQPAHQVGRPGLEPSQVVQLPGPLRPPRRLRRAHRRVPLRPVHRLAMETRPGPGRQHRRLLPVGQLPDPLSPALQLRPPTRRQRRHIDVRGRRDVLSDGGAGGQFVVVLPVVQQSDALYTALRLRPAHRPDLHDYRAAGRYVPGGVLSRGCPELAWP